MAGEYLGCDLPLTAWEIYRIETGGFPPLIRQLLRLHKTALSELENHSDDCVPAADVEEIEEERDGYKTQAAAAEEAANQIRALCDEVDEKEIAASELATKIEKLLLAAGL